MRQEAEEKDSAGQNTLAKLFEGTFAESGTEEGMEEGREEEEEEVVGNTSALCNDVTAEEEEEEEVNREKALAKSLNLEIATFLQKLPSRQETIVFEKQ